MVEILFLCSLFMARRADVVTVMRHVLPTDFETPSVAVVFEAAARLVAAGNPYGSEAVLAELTRAGQASDSACKAVLDANGAGCSGLEAELRYHAGAIVGRAYRRHFESWGKALVDAAENMAERDLMILAVREGLAAREHSHRLAALRLEEVAA